MKLKKRKVIVIIFFLSVLLLTVVFYLSPYSTALLKSKSHFINHISNDKVLYEPGAENYADRVASYLPIAIKRVEQVHGLPFKESFNIYVCNTQKSLNEFIAHPPEVPIRGTVLFGNVFIAPSAFNWNGEDTHKGSLVHELSHLHLSQQLGFWSNRVSLPVWFKEGLANFVCDCAGEGISDEEAISSIKNGYHFIPDNSGNIFKVKRSHDYALNPPMFHKQTKLFVTFLNEYDEKGFSDFLLDVQSDNSFAGAFENRMGASIIELWDTFILQIQN